MAKSFDLSIELRAGAFALVDMTLHTERPIFSVFASAE